MGRGLQRGQEASAEPAGLGAEGEDGGEYDGEFRFDRRAIGALQGLAPDCVMYVGSTSRTLAPALRLGRLVTPSAFVEALSAEKFLTDHGTAALDQLALAEMISSGAYDRHIRQSRTHYRLQREALEAAVRRHRLPLRLAGIPAGVQTLATLPQGHDADGLVRRAAAVGVAFDSVTRYQLAPDQRARSLVIGYGNITAHGIDQAMAALARLLEPERATASDGMARAQGRPRSARPAGRAR